MASVNSVRIPGLATGMDTDSIIKDMLTGQQNKIDKAKQKEQTIKWQQETYRDIIKDVKGLSDKYFTATSKDYILSSKNFSTTKVNSSNSSIVSATTVAGASDINYKFKVDALAQPPRVESNSIDKNQTLGQASTITINGELISLEDNDTISSVIGKINNKFPNGEVKSKYSEMTGTFTIEGQKTGISSELSIDGQFFTDMGIATGTITGSNSKVTVYASDGITQLNEFNKESNSFTVDNITYSANGVSDELISMTSQTDTKTTADKMKLFIDDYNKIMDKIYSEVIEKKNPDFPPLTDAQREDMSEEEIKNWEEKSKKGMLRNDSELRMFMEDTKQALFGPIEAMGGSILSDIGITSSKNYNEQGQIYLDEEKFEKALLEKGDQIYQALTKTATDKSQSGSLERIKDVFNKYTGNSNSIFARKAGIEKTASAVNNLFGEQIKRQQENIKNIQRKMQEKEQQLYKKFAALEASMNKFNSQMNYLIGQ
jgi:flagellar hook-associated protein 2